MADTNTNIAPEERISKTKSIYDATAGEIIWRNFLAGFSRTLGGLILYVVFILVIGGVLVNIMAPYISPLMGQLESISGSLERIPKF